MPNLSFEHIQAAAQRLDGHIKKTPVLSSDDLNQVLGHRFFFKAECFQKTGAFKVRGALNTLLWLQENDRLPKKVVAYSSGNHAQAVAWACKKMKIPAHIFMPKAVSSIKLSATRSYGAKVTLCDGRQEAEDRAHREEEKGAFLLPPYDHDQVICGQGTACLEALEEMDEKIDAVFAPCGGGGLLSGTYLAASGHNPGIQVFGGEPEQANDAVRTLKTGQVFRWKDSPDTIADGAKTLSVSERTLKYIRQLDGLYEIPEEEIVRWTQYLHHYLKVICEPTAALGMAAAQMWLNRQNEKKRVLVILSGGNISQETFSAIWKTNQLL